jgi:hypothetical protein
MRSFMICTAQQILLGDQIKKNDSGRACRTYGGQVHTVFWWGNVQERDHSEDLGVDGP